MQETRTKLEGGLRTKGFYKKSELDRPLISIITPVRNGEKYLEGTIKSVINQTYDNIEYIIVDGGSTDKTVDIIKKYEEAIDYWISEADEGISDAFNKGICLSNGEIIGIIGADDWYELDAIETIVQNRQKIKYFCYGGCTYIDALGNQKYIKPDRDYAKKIKNYMPHIHHPTVFVLKQVYKEFGLYSKDYRIAMDYEFILRLFSKNIVGISIDRNISYVRKIGISNTSYLDTRKEVYNISTRYGISKILAGIFYFLFIIKYLAQKIVDIY